jgi:uncharacterized protein
MSTIAASTSDDAVFLKPFWASFIGPSWVVALTAYAAIALVRFFAFLGPYPLQELFFLQTVAMWALPFIVLTPEGRRAIGLTSKSTKVPAYLFSALAGAACALILFGVGMAVYGASADNWCISLRNYLHVDEMRGLMPPIGLFGLYALPAIFLNPIGEEILFRGFIQEAFARRFNPAIGTAVNVVLFGLIYLYIHGIYRDPSGLHLRLGSAVFASVLLACFGGVFTLCRRLSGSLWPAIAAHAAFNLTVLAAVIHQFVH